VERAIKATEFFLNLKLKVIVSLTLVKEAKLKEKFKSPEFTQQMVRQV
jgi:hypothetical protein